MAQRKKWLTRVLIPAMASAFVLMTPLGERLSPIAPAQGQDRSTRAKRLVLVELYTSQGCDMCPEAEENLGNLGDRTGDVATVAFHVDYFDRPWKDPFSDKLHSERQMSYHQTYRGPKHPELGLYYTPMMMVDGLTTVNGRDPARLKTAVASARRKPPGVAIDARLADRADRTSARLDVTVRPLSNKIAGRDVLICAVLRDDKVKTDVKSGENADKALTNRFPARKLKFEKRTVDARDPVEVPFEFPLDPAWDTATLSIVVFVQDVATGEVHQAAILPVARPERP